MFCWRRTLAHQYFLCCFSLASARFLRIPAESRAVLGNELSRGSFSHQCKPFPNQRVVLVTVNGDYVEFFQNWYHYAKPFLQTTEHLYVVAEDKEAARVLHDLRRDTCEFTLIENEEESSLSQLTSQPRARKGKDISQAPYDSKMYSSVVLKRPREILHLLDQGCTVLYSDIDAVWVKDPFVDIGAANPGNLYVTDDGHSSMFDTSTNYCTCFLYIHPHAATKQLMEAWSHNNGSVNQPHFNAQLDKVFPDKGLQKVVLPVAKFPPGNLAQNHPNATVFHANYVVGERKKVEFFEERGIWSGSPSSEYAAADEGNDVQHMVEDIVNHVTAGVGSAVEVWHALLRMSRQKCFPPSAASVRLTELVQRVMPENYCVLAQLSPTRDEVEALLMTLERSLRSTPSDAAVIELGVALGGTTSLVSKLLDNYAMQTGEPRRKHLVYDAFSSDAFPDGCQTYTPTFCYLPELVRRAFNNIDTRTIVQGLFLLNKVTPPDRMVRGFFSDVAAEDFPGKVAFAFFDSDSAESITDSFGAVYHRMVPNSSIAIHDYNSAQGDLSGVRKAATLYLGKNLAPACNREVATPPQCRPSLECTVGVLTLAEAECQS